MTDQQPGSEPPGYGYGGSGWSGPGGSPYDASGYGAGSERPDFYAPESGYGAPGYGGYGYGGYGYGYGPSDPKVKSQAVTAFVVNIIACILCCGVASLPGLICGGIAMSKAETEPESARNLTKWAWICLGITVGIAVLFITFIVILGVTGNLDDSSSDY